jgi:hypothetical protein
MVLRNRHESDPRPDDQRSFLACLLTSDKSIKPKCLLPGDHNLQILIYSAHSCAAGSKIKPSAAPFVIQSRCGEESRILFCPSPEGRGVRGEVVRV